MVKNSMTIEEYKKAKLELENDIHKYISHRVREFCAQSGVHVTNVSVNMRNITNMCGETYLNVIFGVSVDTDL